MSARENSPLTCAQAGPMIAAMLLGELGPRDERAVLSHVHLCGACQREMEAIESTILFLEENNPLVEAPVEQLSEDRMSELMEAAALSDIECNVEAMDAARVPSAADERAVHRANKDARRAAGQAAALGDALTLRAALARWGVPTVATRPMGPAFAGLAATVMCLLGLLVSLWSPGGEAVARNESASRYSALKPIRVVEVTVSEPVTEAVRLEQLARPARPAPHAEAMVSGTGTSDLNIGSTGATESLLGPTDGPNG